MELQKRPLLSIPEQSTMFNSQMIFNRSIKYDRGIQTGEDKVEAIEKAPSLFSENKNI